MTCQHQAAGASAKSSDEIKLISLVARDWNDLAFKAQKFKLLGQMVYHWLITHVDTRVSRTNAG